MTAVQQHQWGTLAEASPGDVTAFEGHVMKP